ncbi:hypothetical protein CMO89_04365 [Candidatus Woesearchaeota archaeon]|nr:hypothetical protein [Candidatus Woesearchaeota archaeon]|tara:strand:- start:16279 stop:16911 length:633 start_codon:yes stop_codon:yes gene_type:complete
MNDNINGLIKEDASLHKDCNLCSESSLKVGQRTDYGAVIVFRIGSSAEDSWFATLSPKTGGDPEQDFTIQLMPQAHLTHFCQVSNYPKLAENYGTAFSKVCNAMAGLMAAENKGFKVTSESKEDAVSMATYGKCTNWKEKKEHLHIKVFPFRGDIGQPYTVDSSFGRKEVHKDSGTGEEFVKMKPVRKVMIGKERFEKLANQLISLLNIK